MDCISSHIYITHIFKSFRLVRSPQIHFSTVWTTMCFVHFSQHHDHLVGVFLTFTGHSMELVAGGEVESLSINSQNSDGCFSCTFKINHSSGKCSQIFSTFMFYFYLDSILKYKSVCMLKCNLSGILANLNPAHAWAHCFNGNEVGLDPCITCWYPL